MNKLNTFINRIFVLLLIAGCASASQKNFQVFFDDFLVAAEKSKYEFLITKTIDPLEVKGELDFIPIKYIEKDQLPEFFSNLFDQEVGAIDKESMTLLKKLKGFRDDGFVEDQNRMIRVESLVFQYIDSKWLLVRVYINE